MLAVDYVIILLVWVMNLNAFFRLGFTQTLSISEILGLRNVQYEQIHYRVIDYNSCT